MGSGALHAEQLSLQRMLHSASISILAVLHRLLQTSDKRQVHDPIAFKCALFRGTRKR